MPRPFSAASRPLVGVSDNFAAGRHDLRVEYPRAIAAAGALPLIIPYTEDEALLEASLSRLDGVLLTGGGDIHPAAWGEKPHPAIGEVNEARDRYDFLLIKLCVLCHVPLLAICRGLQCVNVRFGGSLYQDLPAQLGEEFAIHHQSLPTEQGVHTVSFSKGTRTASLLPALKLCTNSHHHQAVRRVGEGLRISGSSPDGIVEALEAVNYDIVAFQFHPERMIGSNPQFLQIFKKWVEHLK